MEDSITSEDEGKLMDLLENQNFTKEGKRATIQYGQHYRYVGSKTQPQPMPNLIENIMTRLGSQFAKSHPKKQFHYELNSCLNYRYANGSETLPENSDITGLRGSFLRFSPKREEQQSLRSPGNSDNEGDIISEDSHRSSLFR